MDASWKTVKLSVVSAGGRLAGGSSPFSLLSAPPKQMVNCECASHMTSKGRQNQSSHLVSAAVSPENVMIWTVCASAQIRW